METMEKGKETQKCSNRNLGGRGERDIYNFQEVAVKGKERHLSAAFDTKGVVVVVAAIPFYMVFSRTLSRRTSRAVFMSELRYGQERHMAL